MISEQTRNELFAFLVGDLNLFLNSVDASFFTSIPSDRQKALERFTEKHSIAIKICSKLFITGSYQESCTRLYRLAKAFGKPTQLIVQSATPLDRSMRDEFVKALSKQYPNALIQLRVSPELFGGMRLFLDGTLLDETWSGTLRHLMQSIQQRLYVS